MAKALNHLKRAMSAYRAGSEAEASQTKTRGGGAPAPEGK